MMQDAKIAFQSDKFAHIFVTVYDFFDKILCGFYAIFIMKSGA